MLTAKLLPEVCPELPRNPETVHNVVQDEVREVVQDKVQVVITSFRLPRSGLFFWAKSQTKRGRFRGDKLPFSAHRQKPGISENAGLF